MPRFVILKHETPADYERPTHWDLMLEEGGSLVTWALSEAPQLGRTMAAEKLADHRLAYLEYEGPISDGRGSVTRVDGGEYVSLERNDSLWRVRLSGDHWRGELTLRTAGEAWQAEF